MNRACLAISCAALVAACNDGRPAPRSAAIEPAPSASFAPAPIEDANRTSHPQCWRPWSGGGDDRKFDPKPIDSAKLDEVERAPMSSVEREYARTRVYFEAQHFADAASGFRAIALQYPAEELGIYSGMLYLESLNMLGVHARRAECYEEMARDVPILFSLYCNARRSQNEEQCVSLEKIQLDIDRLGAQKLVEAADKSGDPATYRAAGEAYLVLVHKYCMPALPEHRCDEITYNAAIAFHSAHDDESAERVSAIMREPKNGMSRSPLAARLACKLDRGDGGPCR